MTDWCYRGLIRTLALDKTDICFVVIVTNLSCGEVVFSMVRIGDTQKHIQHMVVSIRNRIQSMLDNMNVKSVRSCISCHQRFTKRVTDPRKECDDCQTPGDGSSESGAVLVETE